MPVPTIGSACSGALGLSIHSFIDGLGIGLAFGLDSATGFLVFIAVISHDFADGLNTVSFILSQSGDRRSARKWLRIDAIAPLLGAIVGSLVTVSDLTLGYILCVYSGFFLYMGATDLLPEAHAHASWARVALTASGFVVDLRDHPRRRRLMTSRAAGANTQFRHSRRLDDPDYFAICGVRL